MSQTKSYDSFLEALSVVNAALASDHRLRDRLTRAVRHASPSKRFVVKIEDDDADSPEDVFTVRVTGDGFVIDSHGPAKSIADERRISRDLLDQLAARPRYYIQRPDKIDLRWLEEPTQAAASTVDASTDSRIPNNVCRQVDKSVQRGAVAR